MKEDNQNLSVFGNSPHRNKSVDSRGVGYVIHNILLNRNNQIMQIDALTGKTETYKEFLTKSIRTAIHMTKNGLQPQDKITICSYNTLNSAVPLIASFFNGIIPNTLDPSFSLDDFKYYLNLIKPKMIFVCPEAIDLMTKAAYEIDLEVKIVSFGKSEKYVNFDTFLEATEEEENSFEPFCSLSCMETAIILFSSGTTGKPKAICLSHNNLLLFTSYKSFFDNNDKVLFYSSLYWISQVFTAISNITEGFKKVVYPKYDGAENFCKVVRKFDVNTLFFPPCYLAEIVLYCKEYNITFDSKNILLGGTSVPLHYVKLAAEVFPNGKLLNMYGQTEIGFISGFSFKEVLTEMEIEKIFKGSSGKVAEGRKVRIVNLDSEETAKIYEEGEIRVKCQAFMNGYYQMDSSHMFDGKGWIKTGDVGYFDEDGYLYITGRCKEMIKYKSFPVCPAVLEEITLDHPAVKQCVVTGLPHELDGDHPIAFVTLKNGCQADPEDIKEFVDQRVDDRKKLRGGVVILESIPVTVTGKPQRRALQSYLPKVNKVC